MEEFSTILQGTDTSEIKSTNSKEENKKALFKKLRSGRYKCIVTAITTILTCMSVIWVGILVKGTQHIISQLNIDLSAWNIYMKKAMNITEEKSK